MNDSRKITTLSQGCTAAGPSQLFSSTLTVGNALHVHRNRTLLLVAINKYLL